MKKSQIYFHRAHRKISFSWKTLFVESFLFIPFCWLLILYAYPSITRLASQFLVEQNIPLHSASTSALTEKAFVLGRITTPQIPGRYPTPQLTFAVFIVSLLLIFVATRIRIPKPVAIWVIFICLVNLVSVMFFTFWPAYFPYTHQRTHIKGASRIYEKEDQKRPLDILYSMKGAAMMFCKVCYHDP